MQYRRRVSSSRVRRLAPVYRGVYGNLFSLVSNPLPYSAVAGWLSVEVLGTYGCFLRVRNRSSLRQRRRVNFINRQHLNPREIMPIIDIHPHIVSPDTKKYPLSPLGGTQSTWSSERTTTYPEPSRFTGIYSIDVLAPDVIKTFDHWLGRGCSGMRLFTTGSTLPDQATWFADPKSYPFWEHASAKNIPVCVQMKQEGIPLLRQIMDKFPKVTIILDHLSHTPFQDGPPYAEAAEFLALAKYKQVHLKITPLNVTPKSWGKATPETFFGRLIDTFGVERIAWGSN
ncbi:MAG: amidohydrolase family protein, partial [Rhizobiales bacterium]|nr:amidohydrolase family protein [Hyphomicrobiales bacterium]